MTEAQIAKLVENYRRNWQKMKRSQQQRTIQTGGLTPEQYERMLRGSLPSPGTSGSTPAVSDKSAAPDYHRGPDANALDSLGQSLIDLNAIRDVNVDRVQKDGCPPEVTSRIAELRGRLARLEGGAGGNDGSSQAASPARRAAGNPLDAAANWFKGDDRGETAGAGGPNTDQLLDSVLPSSEASRPKLATAVTRRKAPEENVAEMKAELGQLLGTCVAVKQ
jgi:hypothetical protein